MRMFGRTRRRGLLAAGTLGVVAMLASGMPAEAGGVGIGDPVGDTIDPLLTQNEAAKMRNGASQSTDITGWSLSNTFINGHPALRAVITVVGPLPSGSDLTAFRSPYPVFNGATYMITYQNKNTQINSYGLPPACTNKATGQPVYDFQEHWMDGYRHYIGAEITWDGTKFNANPMLGTYDPSPDGGYGFYEISHEAGMAGKWALNISGNTIEVIIATKLTQKDDVNCAGGILTTDLGSPGHNIANVAAMSWLNQTVVFPVPIPTGTVESTVGVDVVGGDIESVGGLISNSDFTTLGGLDAYDMGLLPWPNPDNAGDGPTCPTPTFGGLAPRNPLFREGQPCQVDNPTGQHHIPTNINFIY